MGMDTRKARGTARLKTAAGFTLIETLVVVSIVGVLVGIAAPNYLDWNRKYKLSDAVGLVHSNMGFARLNAINQNATATITMTQASSASPVTVAFTGVSGLAQLTLDSEVSLSNAAGNAVGAGVNSPQTVQFNSMGLRVNTGNGNNVCVSSTGAGVTCSSTTSQVFNFKNSKGINYRIVVSSTGKMSWCYTSSCAQ